MNKRTFNKTLLTGILGIAGLSLFSACASKISPEASDQAKGDPYRCTKCGYLTRSKTDLTGTRCPHCFAKKMVRISEEEMAKYLKESGD